MPDIPKQEQVLLLYVHSIEKAIFDFIFFLIFQFFHFADLQLFNLEFHCCKMLNEIVQSLLKPEFPFPPQTYFHLTQVLPSLPFSPGFKPSVPSPVAIA